MARAKTARQIAASRKNIKKAQIASARKRRGTGKSKRRVSKKQLRSATFVRRGNNLVSTQVYANRGGKMVAVGNKIPQKKKSGFMGFGSSSPWSAGNVAKRFAVGGIIGLGVQAAFNRKRGSGHSWY